MKTNPKSESDYFWAVSFRNESKTLAELKMYIFFKNVKLQSSKNKKNILFRI